jgi:hypothetical protein
MCSNRRRSSTTTSSMTTMNDDATNRLLVPSTDSIHCRQSHSAKWHSDDVMAMTTCGPTNGPRLRYYWYSSLSLSKQRTRRQNRPRSSRKSKKSPVTIFKKANGEKGWIIRFVAERFSIPPSDMPSSSRRSCVDCMITEVLLRMSSSACLVLYGSSLDFCGRPASPFNEQDGPVR